MTEAVTGTDKSDDKDDSKEDKKELSEYALLAKSYANELAKCTDAESFNKYVENYLNETAYADVEDAEKKAESVKADMDKLETKSAPYSESSDISKKIFDMKPGETYVYEDDDNGNYTAYLVTVEPYREDYVTKDARIIVLSDANGDVNSKIDEINAAINEGITDEKFAEALREVHS